MSKVAILFPEYFEKYIYGSRGYDIFPGSFAIRQINGFKFAFNSQHIVPAGPDHLDYKILEHLRVTTSKLLHASLPFSHLEHLVIDFRLIIVLRVR